MIEEIINLVMRWNKIMRQNKRKREKIKGGNKLIQKRKNSKKN